MGGMDALVSLVSRVPARVQVKLLTAASWGPHP